MVKIGINEIQNMVLESLKRILNEVYSVDAINEHLDTVDNFASIEDIISQQWESPDDVWFINIDQRRKDWIKKSPEVKKMLVNKFGKRIKYVGYAYIKGNTKEEAIKQLYNAKVYLYQAAAERLGTNIVSGKDSIKNVCDAFYARAYILIHKRSFNQTSQECGTNDIHSSSFIDRVHVSNVNIKQHQWTLVDCDVDDASAQKELEDIFAKYGLTPVTKQESHNGMHYIFDNNEAGKIKGIFDDYNEKHVVAGHHKDDPAVLAKRDSSMLLYSPCGQY